MSHSIRNQLQQSVSAACHPGGSKRSERSNPANDWKIYSCGGADPSKTYAGYLRGLAGELGTWIRENYPDCKMAYQISPSILQGFLNSKADRGVAASTIRKDLSGIRKLEKCVGHQFRNSRIDWKTTTIHVPDYCPEEKQRDRVMDDRTYRDVLDAMSRKTETYKSLILSRVAGLRVRETCLVHRECVHLDGGRYGYGYITLRSGAIDGAKHGRPRSIDILSASDRDTLREICRNVRPGQTVMRKSDGEPYRVDSVQRAITRACVKLGIGQEWSQNKNHAVRKSFAQRAYDVIRKETAEQGYNEQDSRRMAEDYVSDQLGHGVDRADRERLLDVYIGIRW